MGCRYALPARAVYRGAKYVEEDMKGTARRRDAKPLAQMSAGDPSGIYDVRDIY